MTSFLTQDFTVLLAGLLASLSCAIIGCFLVLRKMSLMGDAISHAVLPGIVGAFLLHTWLNPVTSDSVVHVRNPVNLTMMFFAGAVIIGVLTAALSELVHRLGRVEPGASMGVVFTVLFALGVIMLERTSHTIHLDADCVLYGVMESAIWPTPPTSWSDLKRPEVWQTFPYQLVTLLAVLIANAVFIVAMFKELRITSFDPALATAQGIPTGLVHYLLMTFVAFTTVAAFEAVGSILVVAMLIVPGLIAHLLCDRLWPMLAVSAAVAGVAAISGYAASVKLDVNAAGMIGVMLGALLAIAGLFAPRFGWLNRMRAARSIETTASR
jgi:manganese/zinc/iron transport system permease protein